MTSSMESHCLPTSRLPHTTQLFAAYLDHFDRVRSIYAHEPTLEGVLHSASEVRWDPAIRREVVAILREQNQSFGADAATAENLHRLENGAVAVVTGQQVGLFTGPAYTFYKALSAFRWAQLLTGKGTDAVPIFWLATEDHDLAEVDHCWWPTRSSLDRLTVNPYSRNAALQGGTLAPGGTPAPAASQSSPHPISNPGARVGEIPLGPSVLDALSAAVAALEGPAADSVAAALRDYYLPGADFGIAFARTLARALAGFGLIILNPLDPRLHRLASGLFRRALDQAPQFTDDLLARGKQLESANFHSQVRVTRQSTLLFLNVEGRREPLRLRNSAFSAGNRTFTAAELSSALESAPLDFSPNALFRPVVQDFLLPTAVYIAGPAEVAYFAQAESIYRRLQIRMPAIVPRAGFTLIEPRVARLLKKYKLSLEEILAGRQLMRARMEREFLPKDLARRFRAADKSLARVLKGLRKPVGHLDATLLGAVSTAERKMLYQLEKLRQKSGRAEGFRAGILAHDERLLLDSLYPQRGLQERSLCFLPFLAAHGPALLETLAARSANPAQHQILLLSS